MLNSRSHTLSLLHGFLVNMQGTCSQETSLVANWICTCLFLFNVDLFIRYEVVSCVHALKIRIKLK